MIIVEEWVARSTRDERTAHLDLDTPCKERGGNSTVHRGVLAEHLDTNIPKGVDLCHACHNDKCSNPRHLYWGTRAENVNDARVNGTFKGAWENLVSAHGYEGACDILAKRSNPSKAGKGNTGKKKSEEHKKNISNALKK